MWPNRKLIDLLKIELPIIQAPMAGVSDMEMAVAVSSSGGLGSLPCAMLRPAEVRSKIAAMRDVTSLPINANFFCHRSPQPDPRRDRVWEEQLAPYRAELADGVAASPASSGRAPFDAEMCEVVEEARPEVVSFHFGLPDRSLVRRVKACGSVLISSATTVTEARWLDDHGCDAIIAQGYEAGGHRGMFLSDDIATQTGTLALVPQVVDAVSVPVIAAGGIADGRGIAAAFALGASAVQIGTAYLLTRESLITHMHRAALRASGDRPTALTNVFTGKPARGIVNRIVRELGPISDIVPEFPTAGAALAPIKASAEAMGSTDFSPLWSGQAAALARETSAGELTRRLGEEAREILAALGAH